MGVKNEMRDFAIALAEGLDRIGVAFRKDQGELPMSVHMVRFPASGVPEVAMVDLSSGKYGSTKPEIAKRVRKMATQWGARYVLMQNEAWMSFGQESEHNAAAEWMRAGHSLETFPDRKEMMMVHADGPDLDLIIHREIAPDGSIGDPARIENGVTTGTLTNLSGRGVAAFPDQVN